MTHLTSRIGCFFMIVGAAVLMLFLASDQARQPQLNYLLFGLFAVLIGFSLWRKGRPAPRRSGRFRLLRGQQMEEEEAEEVEE